MYEVVFRESGGWTGLDVLVALREALSEMPVTKTQFAPRMQLPDEVVPWLYSEDLLVLLGTWPVPPRFHTGRRETYTNPRATHARRYADVVATCECGAVLVHERLQQSLALAESSHSEECTAAYRSVARSELVECRREWIEKAGRCCLTAEQASVRMGIPGSAFRSVCYRMDISWAELRREGREDLFELWSRLRDAGYSSSVIGAAFGFDGSSVRAATT